jgi:hypothetical protein
MEKTKYGVSYYGSYHKDRIKSDIDEIKSSGFDILVLAVSENDWNNFRGVVKFSADYAKSLGLEVIVDLWGFAGCFGGEAGSSFLANNPETRQVLNNGEAVAMACINNAKLREFLKSTLDEMAKGLDIDGFFIDEPHFFYDPIRGQYACHCKECVRIAASQGLDLSDKRQLLKHKNASIVSFSTTITRYVKQLDPRLLTILCVFPEERDAAYSKADLAGIISLDVISTDPYWEDPYWKGLFEVDDDFVVRKTRELNAVAKKNKKISEVWIQGFSIKRGHERLIEKYLKAVSDEKPDRVMIWTYRCGWGSSVSCDDPELCWSVVKNSLSSISRT